MRASVHEHALLTDCQETSSSPSALLMQHQFLMTSPHLWSQVQVNCRAGLNGKATGVYRVRSLTSPPQPSPPPLATYHHHFPCSMPPSPMSKGHRTRELAAELTGDRDGSSAAASRVRCILRAVSASQGSEENIYRV